MVVSPIALLSRDQPARRDAAVEPVRRVAARLGLVAFVVALGYLVVMPLYRLQERALADGAAGYRSAYSARDIGRVIWATVGLAVGSLMIALVLGTALAWAASRLPPRLRVLRVLPVLPIVVPAVASVIGWAFLFSPRPGYLNALLRRLPWWSHLESGPVDVYTLPWIVLITGLGLTAFVYLFVSAGFANISSELIEAAQVSGSRELGCFMRITLPLLRPVLVYGGGVALLIGLGQFTAPLLLGRNANINVLTTKMYFATSQVPIDYGASAALGSPLLVFGLIVVFGQRRLLRDHARFVTHGGKSFKSEAKPSKLAVAAIVGYSFIATVLPITALVIVSLSRFWSAKIDVGAMTLDNFRRIFDDDRVISGITTSLLTSLGAVAIAIPIGFVAATLLVKRRRNRMARGIVDVLVTIPLGIPAVVFGAGFLFTYTREPFFLYGTRWVIVLVYVTLMLPFTTRMQMSAMVSLGSAYEEASRASGAGLLRTNLKVVLPLLRPAICGAGALMFVLLTHEFAASLLVRAPTTQVMGTVLYDFYVNGSYPLVAAIALVMTVVTAAGVTVAVLLGGSDALDRL